MAQINLMNQTACGHPKPKGMGYASGPHARPVSWRSEIIESSLPGLPDLCNRNSAFEFQLIGLSEHKLRARVHFIPNLKVGVFVTLRAPDVIKNIVYKNLQRYSFKNLSYFNRLVSSARCKIIEKNGERQSLIWEIRLRRSTTIHLT